MSGADCFPSADDYESDFDGYEDPAGSNNDAAGTLPPASVQPLCLSGVTRSHRRSELENTSVATTAAGVHGDLPKGACSKCMHLTQQLADEVNENEILREELEILRTEMDRCAMTTARRHTEKATKHVEELERKVVDAMNDLAAARNVIESLTEEKQGLKKTVALLEELRHADQRELENLRLVIKGANGANNRSADDQQPPPPVRKEAQKSTVDVHVDTQATAAAPTMPRKRLVEEPGHGFSQPPSQPTSSAGRRGSLKGRYSVHENVAAVDNAPLLSFRMHTARGPPRANQDSM